jgi:hypothetical protein
MVEAIAFMQTVSLEVWLKRNELNAELESIIYKNLKCLKLQ